MVQLKQWQYWLVVFALILSTAVNILQAFLLGSI